MLKKLHSKTAAWVNKLDAEKQRQVWFNYGETRLTFPKSYRARLNYTHQNPVNHGLVPVANRYPWCSAAWFEGVATPAQVQAIYSFKCDQLRIDDSFDPAPEW